MKDSKKDLERKKRRFSCEKRSVTGLLLGILVMIMTGCDAVAYNAVSGIAAVLETNAGQAAESASDTSASRSKASVGASVKKPSGATSKASSGATSKASSGASSKAPSERKAQPATAKGTWHPSTSHHELSDHLIIRYDDDDILFNFNDLVAVGYGREIGYWRDFELDFGYILSVVDNDSVKIQIYNYTDEPVPVFYVYAERSTSDYKTYEPATEYIIDGYADCKDGVGEIVVRFEEGGFASAAVFKQGDQLYVANHTLSETYPAKRLEFRDQLEEIFENQGIIEEDTLYTENIYYPIVPIKAGETTDTAYWLATSKELVKDDWSDMRKVLTFYNYCRENIAYDNYVISQNDKARWHLYGDYSGDQFASRTGVGICEDVANIIAIMCRAQGIPAMVVASSSHAWDYIYIEDYDRWISVDVTPDLLWRAMNEDPTVLTSSPSKAYTSIEKNHMNPIEVYIGNPKDMQRQNVLYPWEQRKKSNAGT